MADQHPATFIETFNALRELTTPYQEAMHVATNSSDVFTLGKTHRR